ncbi:MAG TPA: restriction endonuclease subunit S, partial [Holophagaceae bacterium]|nr:restriction endonuclease subunit S [Holophagaceae bacterium]
QPNISQIKIRDINISVVPHREQQQIVDRLDYLLTETQRLESLYQRKLAALAALKQSLLHQAFRGEL